MSPFNKFEAIGIFVSVAVMALALAIIRFQTTPDTTVALSGTTQQAGVITVSDEPGAALSKGISSTLSDAVTANGDLVKMVIDDVRVGTGETVSEGHTLTVHYIGSTRDGVQFDSSYARGEPFTFTVGDGRVIQGWEEGLIGMKVGGQRVLVIPSDMAYGNRQVGPIPPNSPLVFAIELLEIK